MKPPCFRAFQVSEIWSCNYYILQFKISSIIPAFCALLYQLTLHQFLFFWMFNPSGLRPAAAGARSANGPAPCHVPGRWHSSTTGGAGATNESFEDGGVSWHWQTFMAWMLGFWEENWRLLPWYLYFFGGIYGYILYNKGPRSIHLHAIIIIIIHWHGCDQRGTCLYLNMLYREIGRESQKSLGHSLHFFLGYMFSAYWYTHFRGKYGLDSRFPDYIYI